jgi:hypothetical protein
VPKKNNAGCTTNPCCTSCSFVFTGTVKKADGSAVLPGATVSVTGPGGYSGSATADGSGHISFTFTATGTYTFTNSAAGHTTFVQTITFASCVNSSACLTVDGFGTLKATVIGCASAVRAGDTVTVSQTGGWSTTATTNASGQVTVTLPAKADTTVSVSLGARFTTASQSLTIPAASLTGCTLNTANLNLAAASGYHCLLGCFLPLADTIFGTDSYWGTSPTLNYDGTLSTWVGYAGATYGGSPGGVNCAGFGSGFTCGSGACTVRYTLTTDGSGHYVLYPEVAYKLIVLGALGSYPCPCTSSDPDFVGYTSQDLGGITSAAFTCPTSFASTVTYNAGKGCFYTSVTTTTLTASE